MLCMHCCNGMMALRIDNACCGPRSVRASGSAMLRDIWALVT